MSEVRILHAHDALAFACRVAGGLAVEGFSVIRCEAEARDLRGRASDALVVIWSPAMLSSEAALAEARASLAARRLIPLALGRIAPPASFAHLPPIDLTGWAGAGDDARWRFALEEIDLALKQRAATAELFSDEAEDDAHPAAHASSPMIIPVRTIAGAGAGLAVLALAALLFTPVAGLLRGAPETAETRVALTAPRVSAEAPPEPASDRSAERLDPGATAPLIDNGATEPALADEETAADPAPSINNFALSSAMPDAETVSAADGDRLQPSLADSDSGGADAPGAPIDGLSAAALVPQPRLPPSPADDFLGVVFRDCLDCPDMAEIPAGVFELNTDDLEVAGAPTEVRMVYLAGFALARSETTFKEWKACVADGGCAAYDPDDAGFGRGARPVINVSAKDAEAYADWLSRKTGQRYRLPSEAEWEYAARAGARTPYAFGASISPRHANYDGALVSEGAAPVPVRISAPVASYPANAFGVYDAHGNVWEWVADCSIAAAPAAVIDPAHSAAACSERVVKGGAYDSDPGRLRASARAARTETAREPVIGFRIARDL